MNKENIGKEKKMQNPRTLSGFMELLPEEQIKFNNILDIIRNTYEKYGFYPLDTPVLEDTNVLLAKAGGETQKQMYSFKKGDSDISMRFDLTVPLAKYVSLYQDKLTFPFKRYQIGKVYRGEKAQRGRFREFYQCDIDIIGNEKLSISNDSEIVSIICEIFNKLEIGKFIVRASNRKIFIGILDALELSDFQDFIMHTIDKIDKIGSIQTKQILLEQIPENKVETLMEILEIDGTNDEKIQKLESISNKIENETLKNGILELKQLHSEIRSYGLEQYFKIDLSIIRRLDYYTSNVFETNLVDNMELGSICSGGRYENLTSLFSKTKMPGVGISIGLTRLFYLLNEKDLISKQNSHFLDYYIIPLDNNCISYAIEVAKKIRDLGYRAQLNVEDMKIQKKFKIADKLNVPYAVIIGQEEMQDKTIKIKDMKNSEQKTMPLEEFK